MCVRMYVGVCVCSLTFAGVYLMLWCLLKVTWAKNVCVCVSKGAVEDLEVWLYLVGVLHTVHDSDEKKKKFDPPYEMLPF